MSGSGSLIALTIAGFDPGSGAGVTADLAVFAAHGIYGTACISALTVQSTVGVRRVEAISVATVAETLDCLIGDLPPAGIKIGMLATAETVRTVVAFARRYREALPAGVIVLDPVVWASSGAPLLTADGVAAMRSDLLPLVDWVTPNVDELGVLSMLPTGDRAEIEAGAGALQKMGAGNVVVTGGDLAVPNDFVLTADGRSTWVTGDHVNTTSTHGTGCAFSSALLCELLMGNGAVNAVGAAKRYVMGALRAAPGLGHGRGPMGLSWPLQR